MLRLRTVPTGRFFTGSSTIRNFSALNTPSDYEPRSSTSESPVSRRALGFGLSPSPSALERFGSAPISPALSRSLATHRDWDPRSRGDGSKLGPTSQRAGQAGKAVGLLSGLTLLLGKTKYLLVGLKLTKFASLGSLLLTTGAYGFIFGPLYGVGMVGQILAHESGHALMMRRLGIPHGPMVFVPFMGAAVEMQKSPHSARDEALVAVAGPVAGTATAAVIAAYGYQTGSPLATALADFGFMINLFNLLPIGQMDGGRIAGALSKYFLLGGVGVGSWLALSGFILNPIFYLILFLSMFETYKRFTTTHVNPNYYKLTNSARAAIGFGYFGLIALLVGLMALNNKIRQSPQELKARMSFEERKKLESNAVVAWAKELEDPEYARGSSTEDWKQVDRDPWDNRR